MDNHELLNAIAELLAKELGEMREEIKELKAGQKQIREDLVNLSMAVGDIVNEMGDMMDDKLSALAHELKWTKDATAQNSMDIAALKKRSK